MKNDHILINKCLLKYILYYNILHIYINYVYSYAIIIFIILTQFIFKLQIFYIM